MPRCTWTDACVFFNDEVGYSIDLQAHMRMEYCLGDSTNCARLRALEIVRAEQIPNDLLPTEHDRLAQLSA